MRVTIVGAGATGARIARQLRTSANVSSLHLRDSRPERLGTVLATLGSDVSSDSLGVDAPLDGDVVVIATPPGVHLPIAERAVRAGADVISLADSRLDVQSLLTLDRTAAAARRSVVIGAGFTPGLSCLLARHAADRFDEVDEIHVAKVGTGGPACARVHHAALGHSAVEWRDGAWINRAGGSGRELCWFPEPVAARDCYRGAFAEPLLLHRVFPDAARLSSRMSATRRDRLTAHLPMLRPPHPEGGPGAIRVEVRGWRDGAHDQYVLGAMDRPANAAATVAAVAVEHALAKRVRAHGCGGLAEMVEVKAFLADLAGRGLTSAVFDGVPRSVGR